MQSCHLACHDQSRRSDTKKGLKRRIGGSEEGGAKDYSHVVKPAGSSRLRLAIFSLLDTLTGRLSSYASWAQDGQGNRHRRRRAKRGSPKKSGGPRFSRMASPLLRGAARVHIGASSRIAEDISEKTHYGTSVDE
ncbi:uncharacterized protein LOC143371400 [Andrena cerasifolii]|uniref:uncharacterized protein LOC143371400 n=1 Tax=Andrena cerasifolii TaxID=2819439 RepID=UPI0040379965